MAVAGNKTLGLHRHHSSVYAQFNNKTPSSPSLLQASDLILLLLLDNQNVCFPALATCSDQMRSLQIYINTRVLSHPSSPSFSFDRAATQYNNQGICLPAFAYLLRPDEKLHLGGGRRVWASEVSEGARGE